MAIKEVLLSYSESVESPIDKILNSKEPATNSKDKNDWVLITDGPQKEQPKNLNTPKGISLNLNQLESPTPHVDNQTPRTDRLSRVDEECAQDFVKTTFHDASEKEIAGIKSDR